MQKKKRDLKRPPEEIDCGDSNLSNSIIFEQPVYGFDKLPFDRSERSSMNRFTPEKENFSNNAPFEK